MKNLIKYIPIIGLVYLQIFDKRKISFYLEEVHDHEDDISMAIDIVVYFIIAVLIIAIVIV